MSVMKVITFYSYKGGQGRTMALACMASLLYRLGKNVVMLDLDFEAPGILSKFGHSVFTNNELRGKGLIKYFEEFEREREVPKDMQTFSVTIAEKTMNGTPVMLRVIPTGYAGSDGDYWTTQASIEWSNFRQGWNTGFYEDIKTAISRMTPAPEYLLVDARAGISEFGSISMIMPPDKIICFFSNDFASQEGIRHVLERHDNPETLPVLSRIPHFLTDEKESKLRGNFSDTLPTMFDKIFMLHSDWDLEIEPFLPIPHEGEVKNIRLVHDYLDLFAAACPEVTDDPDIITHFWNALGFPGKPETIDETYRVFRLRNSQSIMMNLSDNQRNVSFKVETFCAILNDIHRGLVETTHESLTEVEQSFYHAGSLAGANFGKSLMREIWSDPDNMPVKNRLDDWCRFDSGVGFGFMKSTELGENNASGKIVVKDNFLVNNRNRDEANLCSLFSGYIAGVLGEILDFEVDVVHEQSLCMRFTHGQESCVFCFSRKNIIEETGVE